MPSARSPACLLLTKEFSTWVYWKLLSCIWQIELRCFTHVVLSTLFLGGASTSICHFFCPSVHPCVDLSVRPSDHDFWYTYVKWWCLQAFSSFYKNLDFLGSYGGKRAKNSRKWKITITSVTHHISETV